MEASLVNPPMGPSTISVSYKRSDEFYKAATVLVYNLIRAPNIHDIVYTLNYSVQNHDVLFIAADSIPFTSPREIACHHTRLCLEMGRPDHDICLVVDRHPAETEGLLMTNVNYYYKLMPDAVRMPPNETTANAVRSLLSNRKQAADASCWESLRMGADLGWSDEKTCSWRPREKFAIYNLDEDSKGNTFTAVIARLQGGLDQAHYDDGKGIRDKYGDEQEYLEHKNRSYYRQVYVGMDACGKTLQEVKVDHVEANNSVDKTMFAVLDSSWNDKGLLFVKLGDDGKKGDEFRHTGLKTGELLSWIWHGLITWEEAKNEEMVEFSDGVEHPLAI